MIRGWNGITVRSGSSTYVDRASILAIEGDDGLAARGQLDLVLGPETGNDLDAIRARHDDL